MYSCTFAVVIVALRTKSLGGMLNKEHHYYIEQKNI